MKVSIVTVCYNEKSVIENAITSVVEQNYDDIEYIVIDGGSNDGTVDAIKKYRGAISKIVSEPDDGIYDAMNKGLDVATGTIIYFLNADDRFYSMDVVKDVASVFAKDPQIDILSGKVKFINPPEEKKDLNRDQFFFTSKSDLFRQPNPQQCIFCRRTLFDTIGYFNLKYKMCADYEWLLRAIDGKATIRFTDSVFAFFNYQGVSYKENRKRKIEKNMIILKNSSLRELMPYVARGIVDRFKFIR